MERFRVLVVDDEVDFLETMVKRLKKRNLDVMGVKSGEEALQILDKEPVDVVVLDVKMPGMDGEDTLREIKRRKPLVQVIMLTAHGSVDSGIEDMTLGAFDYIVKPADLDGLMQKMEQAYKKKLIHEEKIRRAKIVALDHGSAPVKNRG
ncbi:MAG: response regulator [Deltaproteobacteria bacterium]|nr:response regulator [Deltaproteobacteria bacterium]